MATQLTDPPTIDEVNLAALNAAFEIDDPQDVSNFLADHPWLAPDVLESRSVIDRHFGAGSRVRLSVFHEPEGGPESCMLFASVVVNGPVEDTLAKLDRLDQDWLKEQHPASDGYFVVSVEHA